MGRRPHGYGVIGADRMPGIEGAPAPPDEVIDAGRYATLLAQLLDGERLGEIDGAEADKRRGGYVLVLRMAGYDDALISSLVERGTAAISSSEPEG